ncbi:unnamed protein product [Symbiodinium microadriaticum]|nr:unnamed protein product [Symbiodinium microadriaticum]
MFMSEDEIGSFVESVGYTSGSLEWFRCTQLLAELWKAAEVRASSASRSRFLRLSRNHAASSKLIISVPRAVLGSEETLKASSAVKRQLHWPCRLAKKRALAKNEGGRFKVEAEELQRWRAKLASLLKECSFPVCAQAHFMTNCDRILETAAGATRAGTPRQRIREWYKLSAWCMALKGKPYDSDPAVLVDYMEELYLQPCARTKLKSVLAAVALVEKAGAVDPSDRLSCNRLVLSTVDTRTAELEEGAPETRRAPPMPLSIIASLELTVMDGQLPRYWRAYAWVRLFKVWTSSRTDDLLGVLPGSMRLGLRGLRGVFDRTKTSGPGRRIRWLPFFVSFHCWVVCSDWLETGFKRTSDGFSFERDYLVPRPSVSYSSCRPVMASYPEQATLAKLLYTKLKVPCMVEDQWRLSERDMFLDPAWLSLLSEHSERNFTSSIASAAGVDRERKAYLGRWHVVEASDEYVRTAWEVVTSLQKLIVQTLCESSAELANFALDALDERFQSKGASKEARDLLASNWSMPAEWAAWRKARLDVGQGAAMPPAPEVNDVQESFAFYVTVLGKRRLRRLHRKGGCGTQPDKVRCVEYFESLKGITYDSECRHCFPSERDPPEEEASSVSSSTVRDALAADLPLDVEAGPANRLEMAKLLVAWEAAKLQTEATQRNRAESRLGVQQRLIEPSEHQAMRTAVEQALGTLRDKEVPAKQVIAALLEQIESNVWVVMMLTEVASVEDSEIESFEAKIDPVTNTLKITSGKHSVAAPSTPEELRLRHRRIGLAWDMLCTKHSNRSWLSANMTDCMRRFSDFILGTQVAGGLQVASGRQMCFAFTEAYEKAITDVELLNRYLVILFEYQRDGLGGQQRDRWNAYLLEVQQAVDSPAAASTGHFADYRLPPPREVEEFDLVRGHDLLADDLWLPLLSADWPEGFPWLRGADKAKVQTGTELVKRCLQMVSVAHEAKVHWLWEHPEVRPSSLHCTMPWSRSDRVVLVAYTPFCGPSLKHADRVALSELGFQLPVQQGDGDLQLPSSSGDILPCKDAPGLAAMPEDSGDNTPSAKSSARKRAGDGTALWDDNGDGPSAKSSAGKRTSDGAALWDDNGDGPSEWWQASGQQGRWVQGPEGSASEEDEDGVPKAPRGSGKLGWGPALLTRAAGKVKLFSDGHGLASPGRWPPHARPCADLDPGLSFHKSLMDQLLLYITDNIDYKRVVCFLATGRCTSSPFSERQLTQARDVVFRLIREQGSTAPLETVPERQPFYLHAISEVLRLADDPDWRQYTVSTHSFANGVPLGVDFRMPRCPALFERKRRHRDFTGLGAHECAELRDNYRSADGFEDKIESQFDKEIGLGAMVRMELSEAQQRFGRDLSIASLGCIPKADGSVRVVHDATHGQHVNDSIRVRDGQAYPPGADLKETLHSLPYATFSLSGDISRARRLSNASEQDWPKQACRARKRGSVYLNTVGTFGVTSASYWWTDAKAQGSELWVGGVIGALELLATLIALLLFEPQKGTRGVNHCSAATDNRGNSFVTSRWMTTSFPLNAVLMEVAAILQQRSLHLELHWAPRLQNALADALTNQQYDAFDSKLRLRFDFSRYRSIILKDLMEAGVSLYGDIKEYKEKWQGKRASKLRKGERLTDVFLIVMAKVTEMLVENVCPHTSCFVSIPEERFMLTFRILLTKFYDCADEDLEAGLIINVQFHCARIVSSMELYGFDPTDDTKEKKSQWKMFEKLLLCYRAAVIEDPSRIRAAVELSSEQCPVLNAGPFDLQERWLATLLAGADANARFAKPDVVDGICADPAG